ncbi:Uncharacterised protein [uncultured archaeon]|nr:Uncharacterised protein [uncultured archaeon]
MGLGGATRCSGLPMAETDFWKISITPVINYGNYSLSLGARLIEAKSHAFSMQAGPRTIAVPGEKFVDYDFGARIGYGRKRREPGFVRKATVDVTRFNARSAIRGGYFVYSASVGFRGGWGVETQAQTKTGNVSFGASKGVGWAMGKYALEAGAGYELGVNSIYVYVGGKIGPFVGMIANQTDEGSKSYHLLAVVDVPGLYKLAAGGGGQKTGKTR